MTGAAGAISKDEAAPHPIDKPAATEHQTCGFCTASVANINAAVNVNAQIAYACAIGPNCTIVAFTPRKAMPARVQAERHRASGKRDSKYRVSNTTAPSSSSTAGMCETRQL